MIIVHMKINQILRQQSLKDAINLFFCVTKLGLEYVYFIIDHST